METFLIISLSLWLYPFVGYFISRLWQRRPKTVLFILLGITAVIALCMLANLSTIWSSVNFFVVGLFYLVYCSLLWIARKSGATLLKAVSSVVLVFSFFVGFLLGSVGLLGMGLATSEYTPSLRVKLDEHIVLEEYPLGNALADYRGKQVKIQRVIPLLPFIQYQLIEKCYYDVDAYMRPLQVHYTKEEGMIVIKPSSITPLEKGDFTWPDTLRFRAFP